MGEPRRPEGAGRDARTDGPGGEERLTIGELARRAALTTNTLRYYEAQGLLPPVPRTEAGYRVYGEEAVARLAFIQQAKAVGLSLDEIREILTLAGSGRSPCARVAAYLDEKLAQVDRQLQALSSFRRELGRLRSEMTADKPWPGLVCGLIEGVHVSEGVDVSLGWSPGPPGSPPAHPRAGRRHPEHEGP